LFFFFFFFFFFLLLLFLFLPLGKAAAAVGSARRAAPGRVLSAVGSTIHVDPPLEGVVLKS
jgi:hypothetical protein